MRFIIIMGVFILLMSGQTVQSQSTEKFEIGGQFSVLQLSVPQRVTTTSLSCVALSCPALVIASERDTQLGFGARVAYNISNNFAVEAEMNFFPNADTFGVDQLPEGHNIQGLFGAKIGKRFEKVGVFAKARPGFVSASKGDLEPRPDTGCIAVFPPPVGCFVGTRKTDFAFDLGGVFEFYPTRRTILRFDVGDTIVRAGQRRVPLIFPTFPVIAALPVAAETTHNFQASIGVAFRF